MQKDHNKILLLLDLFILDNMKRIIHPTDTGIAVLIPADEWFAATGYAINELARKDVPAGVPYKIVDVTDIPADVTFRNAWEADFTNPDGYGIGNDAWFLEQESKGQK